ncbi:hypothetical protein MC885_011744 [Smutsia gigantea]|nr:hypothetical protein MC885_011744 [Smutsia gigantea]
METRTPGNFSDSPSSQGFLQPLPGGWELWDTHPVPPAGRRHCNRKKPEVGGTALSKPRLVLVLQTRECCAGFFGPQCQPCPGNAQYVCFGNGICLDGVNGTGMCECGEGFRGTACETCIEGKYGIHCDQAINACEISNGGCSTKAYCKRTTPGSRVCVCKAGYTGDGIVCLVPSTVSLGLSRFGEVEKM